MRAIPQPQVPETAPRLAPAPAPTPTTVERWNLHHRLQHGTLALSMIGLLATGLPIKYAYTGWAPTIFSLLGGFRATLAIHKVSASLLCLVGVWHLAFLIAGWRRNGVSLAMVPNLQDLRDVRAHGAYLLGIQDHPPHYGRYSYLEKFEYLAIFWGMVVMGGSGFVLWFPTLYAIAMPRWMLDIVRIVHSNEAFVALISLAFGHFFFAHFNPAVFPSSSVWYSGRISLHHLMEEHPAEFQELVQRGAISREAQHHVAAHGQSLKLSGWRRALGVVELLIYSAVFYYLLVTFIPLLLA